MRIHVYFCKCTFKGLKFSKKCLLLKLYFLDSTGILTTQCKWCVYFSPGTPNNYLHIDIISMQFFRHKSYIGISFHRVSDLKGVTHLTQLKLSLCFLFCCFFGFGGVFYVFRFYRGFFSLVKLVGETVCLSSLI